jgi:hypothetical protein
MLGAMRHFILLSLLCAGAASAQAPAAPAADRNAVQRAVLDYIEGFYEGDTAKLVRSLRPEMYKFGFYKEAPTAPYGGSRMTYDAAIAFARRVKANNTPAAANAPREITIYEVLDQTASVKIRAWWGTDYMLLGKYDGKWMISHVLWQSPP